MRWCWNALVLMAASLMAVSSAAQTPNGSVKRQAKAPIVIEGRLKQAIGNFVQRFTQSGPTDQIAHWKDQVCPVVLGIDPGQAAFIEKRIGDVARTVRLRPGGSNCLSTLAIVITPDPSGFVAEMLRTYPITLRTDGWDRLKRFVQSTRPVRWISVTDECGYGCGMGSRIRRETSPSLAAMLVVVDATQLKGITVAELSDYVALIALSNPNDRATTHPNSMLALFDGPKVAGTPYELTDFDRSFLATLYHEPVDRNANDQRAMIRSQMERSLRKPPPPKGN
jgi:hypothetical protein